MITENDLLDAIAECQGQRNPNANTCIKLASYYTILNNMGFDRGYSYRSAPMQTDTQNQTVEYWSETEFGRAVNGMSVDDILPLIDEIMETIQVLHPKMYDAVMRKLRE